MALVSLKVTNDMIIFHIIYPDSCLTVLGSFTSLVTISFICHISDKVTCISTRPYLIVLSSPFPADGITYTFGIFVVELMEQFNEGRGFVSLIPSILVGVTLGVGPIASSLTNRYGCRKVTIVGAILGKFSYIWHNNRFSSLS